MRTAKGLVIAGTRSGCGKTSVSLGVMAALAARGVAVSPFKAGPDFIDPGHHALAASAPGREVISHNLDGWMLPRETLTDIFRRRATGDVAVVEGVMGLFDGFSATDEAGSTAQLAKLLGLPVVLVADASSMARSVAAMVSGYRDFDPDLTLTAVVLNRVASPSHARLVTDAVNHALPGVEVLGCLPRAAEVELPSRHLGLVTAGERDASVHARLGALVEEHLDLDLLLEVAAPVAVQAPERPGPGEPEPLARIGLARDQAFCFYYEENLRLLREAGAELVPFSPLADKHLPEDLDGLYLGGGYPELSAFELGQNASLRREIRDFSRSGRPVYAECGGFMYLLDSLKGEHGRTLSMCGVFPGTAVMQERRSALGYREIELVRDCLLGPAGARARGHEFHYSRLEAPPEGARSLYRVTDRRGEREPEGWAVDATLGSYIHLHFGSNPVLAQAFVASCAAGRAHPG